MPASLKHKPGYQPLFSVVAVQRYPNQGSTKNHGGIQIQQTTGKRMRLKALMMLTKERHELYWGDGKLEWVGKKLFAINASQDTTLRGGIVHR